MMMRGTKRKIEIAKRETKQQRSVACSKRRKTVFSKAADLCRNSGANMAVFVTSPDEKSDVVYSFSGHSPASEIADCYLNGKSPPKVANKLGFWWEDPDLYSSCDDLSELNVVEERLERMRNDLMACLEKKQKLQLVSGSDQKNPRASSLGESSPSSQIVSGLDQNPSFTSLDETFGGKSSFSSQIGSGSDQNPSFTSLDETFGGKSSSSSQIVSGFDQNPSFSSLGETIHGGSSSESVSDFRHVSHTSSLSDDIYGESSSRFASNVGQNPNSICGGSSSQADQSTSFSVEEILGLILSSSDQPCRSENNTMILAQETQTEPMIVNLGGYDDDASFWENLELGDLDTDFSLHIDDNPNEEDDYTIDIGEFLNDEEIESTSATS